MTFHYTVQTAKNFDQAVEAVTQETAKIGMRVLHIHNVQETLNSKGFQIEPLKIVEVCSAKHANTLLQKDKKWLCLCPAKLMFMLMMAKSGFPRWTRHLSLKSTRIYIFPI